LHAIKVLGKGSTILENMSKAMKRAFRKVDLSKVTISLVGGHTKMDLDQVLQRYSPEDEAMWRFSAVVRRCVSEALPGAAIDASLLNRFEGKAGMPEEVEEHECCVQGQRFQVVALDSLTGKIVTQTKYTEERVRGKVGPVPESVLRDSDRHEEELSARIEKIFPIMLQGGELPPVMTECTD